MRMAEVAATSIVNTFEPSKYFWTCGQDNPIKAPNPQPRARRPAAQTLRTSTRRHAAAEDAQRRRTPQEAGDAHTWRPFLGWGRPEEGRADFTGLRSESGPCGRPGPLGPPRRSLPGAGHGRHWDPCSPSGACGPPGGAALFPETEPRERDTQPATGGRERARPPGGRASLGLSTSDKPPPTVTFTSWGHAQALTSQDALTRPVQPPQTPSACAVALPT